MRSTISDSAYSFFDSCRPAAAVTSADTTRAPHVPILSHLVSYITYYIPSGASTGLCKALVCLRRTVGLILLAIAHIKTSRGFVGSLLSPVIGALAVRVAAGRWLPVAWVAPLLWLLPCVLLPKALVVAVQALSRAPLWRIQACACNLRPLLMQLCLPLMCAGLSLWCGLRIGCESADHDSSSSHRHCAVGVFRSGCAQRILAAGREHAAEVWRHI